MPNYRNKLVSMRRSTRLQSNLPRKTRFRIEALESLEERLVMSGPDLGIIEVADAQNYKVGQTVTYTLSVSNQTGADAIPLGTPIEVIDQLPTGFANVTASASSGWSLSVSDTTSPSIVYAAYTGDYPINGGDLLPQITVTAQANGDATGEVNNFSNVSVQGDQNSSNDSSSQFVNISRTPTVLTVNSVTGTYGGTSSISATLTGDSSTPLAGKSIDFHLGLTDLGTALTNLNGVATIPDASLSTYNAGYFGNVVTATFAQDSSDNASSAVNNLTVQRASLLITAFDYTETYGQPVATLNASYTGFVNGDTSSNLTTQPTITSPVTSMTDTGIYSIQVTGGFDPNYNISDNFGTYFITKAQLTDLPDNQTKVYGAALPTLTGTATGVLFQDDVSVNYTTTATATSSVSSVPYSILASSLSGTKALDYTIVDSIPGLLTVTPAPLSVIPDGMTKVYGQANPDLNPFVVGVLGSDNVNVNYTTTATQYSDVGGTYPITFGALTGAMAADYAISNPRYGLEITPAPLKVVAANASKVYGQVNPILTGIVSGNLNNDQVGVTFASDATQFSDVNSVGYAINPSGLTGPKAIDYSFTVEGSSISPGTLAITPAPLAVVINNASKVYGQANPTFIGSVGGVLNGDDVNTLYSTTADAASDVVNGGYPITVAGLSGVKAANYSVTSTVPGTLTITPAPLTVTANPASKIYGQANPGFTAIYTGFLFGQDPTALTGTLTETTTATAASSVGLYPITPSGLSSADYAITNLAGNLSVTPAPLTVTANSATKVYGQATPALTAIYSGFVNGDTAASLTTAPVLSTTSTVASHVGAYPITAANAVSANYAIQYLNGTLSVTPATLTVTPNNVVKAYGVAVPTLSASYSGFVNGDTSASLTKPATLSTTATTLSDFGVYPITTTGANASDYTVVNGQGTLTIPTNPAQTAFVTSLYQSILGRLPETSGLDSWLARLNNGVSQSDVINQIYNAPEAVADRAAQTSPIVSATASEIGLVTSLYQIDLNRNPEPTGLNGWLMQLNSGVSSSEVAFEIANSTEARADLATKTAPFPTNPTAQVGLVTALYEIVLNREPELSGLNSWLTQLDNGVSPSDVATLIENSPEAIADHVAKTAPKQA